MSGVTHYAFCLSEQPQSLMQFQGEEKQAPFPEAKFWNSIWDQIYRGSKFWKNPSCSLLYFNKKLKKNFRYNKIGRKNNPQIVWEK